jgi:hypothetical protein
MDVVEIRTDDSNVRISVSPQGKLNLYCVALGTYSLESEPPEYLVIFRVDDFVGIHPEDALNELAGNVLLIPDLIHESTFVGDADYALGGTV